MSPLPAFDLSLIVSIRLAASLVGVGCLLLAFAVMSGQIGKIEPDKATLAWMQSVIVNWEAACRRHLRIPGSAPAIRAMLADDSATCYQAIAQALAINQQRRRRFRSNDQRIYSEFEDWGFVDFGNETPISVLSPQSSHE